MFIESQTEDAEVATQPVILWLNSDPGYSSMLDFMQEIGPFVIDNGETEYKKNPWQGNLNAHLLILENPEEFSTIQPQGCGSIHSQQRIICRNVCTFLIQQKLYQNLRKKKLQKRQIVREY